MSHKAPGLTLLELLITTAIVGMVMTLVTNSLVHLTQSMNQTYQARSLWNQTHFALNRVADSMRSHSIDYQAYKAGKACENIDVQSGARICLGDGIVIEIKNDQLWYQGQPLLGESTKFISGSFRLSPEEDPLKKPIQLKTQLQPRLQFQLEVQHAHNEDLSLSLKTTISSRRYSDLAP